MELSFYQVTDGNLVPSVIKILAKVYASEQRGIFYSPIAERVQVVDKTLWTFSTNEFIPHGDKTLGFTDLQPIYFTSEEENPNHAEVLVMADSLDYGDWQTKFQRVIYIFEDADMSKKAFQLFQDLQKKRENVNYWKQSENGWEKLS